MFLEAHPDFVVDLITVNLEHYLPQQMTRVWLRGVRRDMLGGAQSIPAPLPRFVCGCLPLEELLHEGIPSQTVESFKAAGRRTNMQWHMDSVASYAQNHPQHAHRVAVFDIDRKPDGT